MEKQMVENSNSAAVTALPSALTNDMIIGLTNSLISLRNRVTAIVNEKPKTLADIAKIQRNLDFIEAVECIYSIVTLVRVRIACPYVGTELIEPKAFKTVRYNIRKLIFVNSMSFDSTFARIDFESIINSLDILYAVSDETNADTNKLSNAAAKLIKATSRVIDDFLGYLCSESQDDSPETMALGSTVCYSNIPASIARRIMEMVYEKYSASRWFKKWETKVQSYASMSDNADIVNRHYVLHDAHSCLDILGPRNFSANDRYYISIHPANCTFAQLVKDIIDVHSRAGIGIIPLEDIQPTGTTTQETIGYEMISEDKVYQVVNHMKMLLENGCIASTREIVTPAPEPDNATDKTYEWYYQSSSDANDTVTIIGPSEYTGTYRVITAKNGFLADTVRSLLGYRIKQ